MLVLVLGPTCKMVGLVSGNGQVHLAVVDVVHDYTYSEYRRQKMLLGQPLKQKQSGSGTSSWILDDFSCENRMILFVE